MWSITHNNVDGNRQFIANRKPIAFHETGGLLPCTPKVLYLTFGVQYTETVKVRTCRPRPQNTAGACAAHSRSRRKRERGARGKAGSGRYAEQSDTISRRYTARIHSPANEHSPTGNFIADHVIIGHMSYQFKDENLPKGIKL